MKIAQVIQATPNNLIKVGIYPNINVFAVLFICGCVAGIIVKKKPEKGHIGININGEMYVAKLNTVIGYSYNSYLHILSAERENIIMDFVFFEKIFTRAIAKYPKDTEGIKLINVFLEGNK